MSAGLFEAEANQPLALAPGAWLLPGFAAAQAPALLAAIERLLEQAPLRHLITPGGLPMSVAMSNAGELGWISDRRGYRYVAHDPATGLAWPPIPSPLVELAGRAAQAAGYAHFRPDACLINRYEPGTRLSLHQDRDEADRNWPIVSVSLGLPAVFQFGGLRRADKLRRVPLENGDVVVWGGPSRLAYHGVLPVKPGHHPLTGERRWNLTFRRAG